MSTESAPKPGLKHKLAHELRELIGIFAYLALFFVALATYSTLLLEEFHVSYFAYGSALINALIMSKVIMLGEYAKLGRRHESKPLLITAILKAAQFSVLMIAFHIVEEIIKHLLHGHNVRSALQELLHKGLTQILVRNLVIFCALIPFFAFRELRRVLGEEKFAALFFRQGAATLGS